MASTLALLNARNDNVAVGLLLIQRNSSLAAECEQVHETFGRFLALLHGATTLSKSSEVASDCVVELDVDARLFLFILASLASIFFTWRCIGASISPSPPPLPDCDKTPKSSPPSPG